MIRLALLLMLLLGSRVIPMAIGDSITMPECRGQFHAVKLAVNFWWVHCADNPIQDGRYLWCSYEDNGRIHYDGRYTFDCGSLWYLPQIGVINNGL